MPDLLDRLWVEVINLDYGGNDGWTRRLGDEASLGRTLASNAEKAVKKLPSTKKDRDNLTRLGRFVRYEACFGTLYSMSDPGCDTIEGLSGKLVLQQNGGVKGAFFKSLWELIGPDDDGDWLRDLAKKKSGTEPFADAGPAVAALLKNGVKTHELGRFCAWARYDACKETLRLTAKSGFKNWEETDGLYESLLGTDPSGMEGCPGSWPVKRKKSAASRSPAEPLYSIRAVQACAFSHDSKLLAVAGASGPVRLIDPATGAEVRSCEGIKVHIYRIAFSPDGKQVAAGKIHKEMTVCDSASGKLISSCKRTEDEISALAYAANGDLLCSSWCNEIVVFEGRTGKKLESLKPFDGDGMVNDMEFSPNGRELLAHWQSHNEEKCHATIWSWPGRKQLLEVKLGDSFTQAVCWLQAGKQFAISDGKTGVTIYDRASGTKLARLGDAETELLAVTPGGEHIITTGAEEKMSIWSTETRKRVRQLDFDGRDAAVSPDGEYLIAVDFGKAVVWRLSSLL